MACPEARLNKDCKTARRLGLPVEVLQEGQPKVLHDAVDNIVVKAGWIVRVSSASGLAAALVQAENHAPAPAPAPVDQPLRVFIVPYLPPAEAPLILSKIEQASADDSVPGFIVINPNLLETKEKARLDIMHEISRVQNIRDKYRHPSSPATATAPLAPADVPDKPKPKPKDLKELKEQYLLAHLVAGHWRMASNILEYVDNFLFQSLREKDEEEVRIARQRLQDDLQKKHHGSQHSVRRIAHELLGIATMSKWEYRKELPLPAAEDGMTMKKKLKCHAKKLRKLLTEHTLMGVVPLVWAKLEPMPMITSSGRTIKSNARFTGPEWTA
uniref:Uncharacterized protein n=1 Tax=Oryza glumipatula TaxID=40148 RepID=A0A0D9YAE9_9ORYZ